MEEGAAVKLVEEAKEAVGAVAVMTEEEKVAEMAVMKAAVTLAEGVKVPETLVKEVEEAVIAAVALMEEYKVDWMGVEKTAVKLVEDLKAAG